MLDIHAFLGFDRLVQALRQTPPGHGSTGVLIDQNHLSLLDDIFNIFMEQRMRSERRIHVVQKPKISRCIERIFCTEQALIDQQPLDKHVSLFG